jgi:AcrR family transcriptional regulator
MRDLALRAGVTTPTVYNYFQSKNAIYDAMFGQSATQFAERMAEPCEADEPQDLLRAVVRRFFEFCTSDPPRYQLLFQRTLPGFEPSPESYAPAVRALADARKGLAINGVTEAHISICGPPCSPGSSTNRFRTTRAGTAGPASLTNRSPCSLRTAIRPPPHRSRQPIRIE